MDAQITAKQNTAVNKVNEKRPKKWLFVPLLLVFVVFSYFFRDINSQNSNVNHENYRVLFEASEQLNNNLNKLKSAHENGESAVAIRAIFSSYKAKENEKEQFKEVSYKLEAKKLVVISEKASKKEIAELSISDVLPAPTNGFSKYLFADDHGHVISTVGSENKLAFSNLDFIADAFKQGNRSILASLDKNKAKSDEHEAKLPTHSSHVDIKLAHGNYRVYVYPFSLSTELAYSSIDDKDDPETPLLFLIGFVEDVELSKKAVSKWNVPIVVISVLSLLVLVSVVKLYLQPKNQYTTHYYRYFVVIICNLAFLASMSLILTSIETTKFEQLKSESAAKYIKALRASFNNEIIEKFNTLETYQNFFKGLYDIEDKNPSALYNYISGTTEQEVKVGSIVYVDYQDPTIEKQDKLDDSACKRDYLPSDKSCQSDVEKAKAEFESSKGLYCTTGDKIKIAAKPFALLENNKESTLGEKDCLYQIIKDIIPSSKKANSTVALFNPLLNVQKQSADQGRMNVHVDSKHNDSLLPNGVISSLVINKHGITSSPVVYYRETSNTPKTISLAHRQYFKAVRDQQGWNIESEDKSTRFDNVFIQRLRNISNGTTGTTISMSLLDSDSYRDNEQKRRDGESLNSLHQSDNNFVLIADVFFNAIATFNAVNANNAGANADQQQQKLNASPKLLNADLLHMVVDRNTGQVLFHSQSERALTENLFYSGNSQNGLTEWVKSASQAIEDSPTAINGQYHGQLGQFYVTSTVVDDWALVVFAPQALATWYMNNQFIFYFVVGIALMIILSALIKLYVWLENNKQTEQQVTRFEQRKLMFWSSIGVAIFIGQVSLFHFIALPENVSMAIVLLELTLLFVMLMKLLSNKFKHFDSQNFATQERYVYLGKLTLFAIFGMLVVFFATHINHKSHASLQGVVLQSQSLVCANQNSKRQELQKIALSLFPNSITRYQYPALKAIGFDAEQLTSPSCNNTSVTPDDFPHYATAKGNQHLWSWLKAYLLAPKNAELNLGELNSRTSLNVWAMLGFPLAIIFLMAFWRLLHTRVLWTLLYFDRGFIEHIDKLARDIASIAIDTRSGKLQITGDNVRLNGVELDFQVNAAKLNPKHIQAEFDCLMQISPFISSLVKPLESPETANEDDLSLPNLKLKATPSVDELGKPTISVELWDLETCLEHRRLRKQLLMLVMDIKGLVLAGKVSSFHIYSGFHCLQRVALKDAMEQEDNDEIRLDHIEYLSWSECLMDFDFKLMPSFSEAIDKSFLDKEVANFPELKSISALTELINNKIENVSAINSTDGKWATINLILIHAEAFYRFKWELCSNAEKLALFNLAKLRFLNPSNCQMIEHLAMNGLIRIDDGRIRLVNESFAYFVLNAEPPETMGKLFSLSEQGVWKNNKATILLSIIFIIVSIAYFSGESLFIIFGSIAGVLTTLATITNSANLLKSNFKF